MHGWSASKRANGNAAHATGAVQLHRQRLRRVLLWRDVWQQRLGIDIDGVATRWPHRGDAGLVHGLGEEVGDAVARHPEVDAVCFTGSYEVGQQIQEICAKDFRKIAA